jgi:Uncharacterized conserved protein
MVTFLPFPGYRPSLKAEEKIEDRISPPYDAIGKEYLKFLQERKNNVTNLTLRPDVDRRYNGARKEFDRMISDGSLKQDEDSFYLYEHAFNDHGTLKTRVGLVGILKTEDYEEGNVIPHEETFSKVKEDRLNLLRDMEAHLESIFGIFEGFTADLNRRISNSAKLIYRYMDSQGVDHRYHRIDDPQVIREITEQLKDQKMLIADGHHRYETALAYSKENPDDKAKGFVLTTMVAAEDRGLVIWPTHRLVSSDVVTENDAIESIKKKMNVKEVTLEEMESQIGDWMMGLIFRSGKCFLARYENGSDLWKLDTYVAQESILKEIYGYDDGKSKVDYDAEYPSAKKSMAEGKYDLAIILNDPSLDKVWELSMEGKRMPKKTTYFFPKIWSGFVFYKM